MCGVAGVVDLDAPSERDAAPAVAVKAMLAHLRHRGPDDAGVWTDDDGVALGNCRLAIVDVSPRGHQPMVSRDGRLVLTFNGEIYNHRELRADLERRGRQFAGHSDTEVLLAAIDEWGVRDAVERVNGMFGFAVWDRDARVLQLGRDRLGEKPMYYATLGRRFAFGSELDAVVAASTAPLDVDRDALALYVRHSCIPAPHTIYRGIRKLEPGCLARLDAGHGAREVEIDRYWSPWTRTGGPSPTQEELEALLGDAVALRMEADVPLGVFLSGGVDSSTIALLAQARSAAPVRTFTIGFDDPAQDEAPFAKEIAQRLGTDHTELRVTAADARAVIPQLPSIYDEPFADPSQIPTLLLAGLARKEVTVALSGDGGDEVFGGYTRYADVLRQWHRSRFALRRAPREERYLDNVSQHAQPLAIVLDASERLTPLSDPGARVPSMPFLEWMMTVDLVTFLPDYILTKVDRATMAVSLESRAPFLDHRLVELASGLGEADRLRRGEGKPILRTLLKRHLPDRLVDRPKMGFDPPLGEWLRGPLRDWGEELLGEARVRNDGYLEPAPVRRLWEAHLAGRVDAPYALWSLLMFQAWLDARP